MRKLWALVLVCAAAGWCQTETTFRGRKGWRLENDQLRVTALAGGGHIAELSLKSPPGGREVNPLWIPPWPSIEPSAYNRDKHGKIYGTDSEAATLSGIMGHNVCFDYWGAPSPAEFRAGLSFHGEASIVEWKKIASKPGEMVYRAELPQGRTALTRTLRVRAGQPVVYFEELAENKGVFDRPFGWVEHVTFGPPFVDAAASEFNASATRGERALGAQRREFQWPMADDKDFRRFSKAERSSDMAFVLLDPKREVEFVSALNSRLHLLVVYVFHRADFPWLNVWEQNRSQMQPPWNGETRTRGMEFGNTRVSGTMRAYFRMPMAWDTPTFGWLDAQGRTTARYLAIVVPIPAEFESLKDVLIAGSEILLVGGRDNQTIRVPFDPALF